MMKLDKRERGFIYSWFSSLLNQELSAQQLAEYEKGSFDSLFAFLSDLGFYHQVNLLRQEISTLSMLDYAQLELAADFTQLFLLDSKSSALPYASAYLEGDSLLQNLKVLDDFLHQFCLQTNRSKNEPSDHLCIYLEILLQLIQSGREQQQSEFIAQQFLPWFTLFCAKVEKIGSKTRFYQILLSLLYRFIKADLLQNR